MKNNLECPNCQGKQINTISNRPHVVLALIIAAIGFCFFVPAVFVAVGYYMFALPMFVGGSIRAYQVHNYPMAKGHCADCDHQFEYLKQEVSPLKAVANTSSRSNNAIKQQLIRASH